jgi:stage II sporulation protein D
MVRLRISLILFLTAFATVAFAQVKVRLFSNHSPESAVFSVTAGKYEFNGFNGEALIVSEGEPVIFTRYNGKLAVKLRNSDGFVCDSAALAGKTGNDSFSLRINGNLQSKQFYSGDFKCFPDLGTIVLINICDIEKYIAGVVLAEGGSGWNKEYFKTQAVITRTYLCKFFNRHMSDKYNVCDNTHCQAFNGVSNDALINRAVNETQGLVLLDHDSTLILSVFHSNCGGETSSSEDVWLNGLSYLRRVVDPYCLSSGNATWEKKMTLGYWIEFMKKSGYKGNIDDPSVFGFFQKYRLTDYKAGTFSIPLTAIRFDMKLKSTFFSLFTDGDSVILKGRGFGHGVGLCQEGAMAMASIGFDYKQIINFYYTGVLISDIKYAVVLPHVLPINPSFSPPDPPVGGLLSN